MAGRNCRKFQILIKKKIRRRIHDGNKLHVKEFRIYQAQCQKKGHGGKKVEKNSTLTEKQFNGSCRRKINGEKNHRISNKRKYRFQKNNV